MTSTTNSPMILSEVAFDASTIGDPDGTRTIIAIIALLVVIGLALIMVAFWMRRVTRPDPEFLAPLELMGERSWRNGDPVWQRRKLDEVRPDDAAPLKRSVAPPRLDESFDAGPSGTGFDDLQQDEEAPESAAPEPQEGVGAVVVGSTTPSELHAVDDDTTRPTESPEWPPRPPSVSGPDVGAGDGRRDDDGDDVADGDGGEAGREGDGDDVADGDGGEAGREGDGDDVADGDGRDGDRWPPTPPALGALAGAEGVGAADEDHVERDDGELAEDPDGTAEDGVGEDDDPTPTTSVSDRPLDDFSDHEIDPAELRRAIAELDEELRRRDDE